MSFFFPFFGKDVKILSAKQSNQSQPDWHHNPTKIRIKGELTCDFGGEGRPHDVFVSKLDSDEVLARHGGQVGNSARTILVVNALNLRLGWSFHRKRQAACTEKDPSDF